MKDSTVEMVASVGGKATVAGAAVGGMGAFLQSNFVGLVGLVIALAGLLVNVHYRRKADKRAALDAKLRMQERIMRMELMRTTGIPVPPPVTDLGELGEDD